MSDGGDGFFAAWCDDRSPNNGLYVQHLVASGAVDPAWPVDGWWITSGTLDGTALAPDGSGGVIVIWQSPGTDGHWDLRAQHVLGSGGVDPSWSPYGIEVCSSPEDQQNPMAVPDGAGGAIVAWNDARTPSSAFDLYAQRVLAGGSVDPAWPAGGRDLVTATSAQYLVELIGDGAGGAIALWIDQRDYATTSSDLYAQRVLASGAIAPGWATDGQVVCAVAGDQTQPVMVTDGAGGAVVAWADGRAGDYDIYAQHVLASGALDAAWPGGGRVLCAATDDQAEPCILEDGAGGAFVAWADVRTSATTMADIYAQHVLASGAIEFGWPADGVAVCTVGQPQQFPRMVSDGLGGFVVAWRDYRSTVDADIYVQHVPGASGPDPTWPAGGRSVASATADQMAFGMLGDGAGAAYVAWKDLGSLDLIGQRIERDGSLDDRLEDNDVCAGGSPMPPGFHPNLAVDSADPDWYQVWLPRSASLTVELAFVHAQGDVDLHVWDACGGTVLASSISTTDNESITFTNLGPSIDVSVQVTLYGSGCNTYDMAIAVEGTSNLSAQVTPSGWTAPVVPRNTTGALPGNTQLTPVLDGNANTTYLNWSIAQEGPNHLPSWATELWLDDETLFGYGVVSDDNAPGNYMVGDLGPNTIRGGRHRLTSYVDRTGQVPETSEDDNVFTSTWVWSPLPLAFETPLVRARPPIGLPTYDGFSYTRLSSYAWVAAIASRNADADDYDLYVFDDYSGSTSGFSSLLGASTDLAGTDLVVGHYSGTPLTVYPGATGFRADVGTEFAIDAGDARNRNHDLTASDRAWTGQVMAANRLADVYEAYLDAGQTYYFSLRRTSGASALTFRVFPGPPGGVYGLTTPISPPGDPTPQSEAVSVLSYTAATTNWHPIVVSRTVGNEADQPVSYDFNWDRNGFVDVPAEALTLAFAGATPNPIRGAGRLEFTLPEPGEVRLSILDLQGRLVCEPARGPHGAGRHAIWWEPRGATGAPLPAGIYWARFEALGRVMTRRLVVLR